MIKFSFCEKDFDIYLFNKYNDSSLLIKTFSIKARSVQIAENWMKKIKIDDNSS